MGDLWGIEQFDYEFYDKNGVSLAIINTEKGEELFRKIENKVEYRLYNEDNVTKFNGNLRQPTLRPQTRDVIYKELDKLSFEKYASKYLKNKNKLKYILKNIIPQNIKVLYKRYFRRGKK